jgi:ABC-2 type transport system permease protein
MRGYVKTAAMSAGEVAENPLFLMDYAMRLLRVVVLLALWRTLLAGRDASSAMPLATVLTYTVVAEVFAQQLAVSTTLSEAFWEGTLVLRFLRPLGLVRQFAAEMSGRWALHLGLFSAPLVLLSPLLAVDPRPVNPVAGALFVVSLCLAVVVGLAMEQPVWLIERARVATATLLSGSLLPLAFYPWGLGDIFGWLPFAAMAWVGAAGHLYRHWPSSGAHGKPGRVGRGAMPLADWLWRANREKLVGYGG